MANGLLVTFAGYPYALSSLFPDNGLASLAAVLRAAGHGCQILDYNTAATMARMVDGGSRAELEALLERLDGAPDDDVAQRLAALTARLEHAATAVADAIGAELVRRCRAERVDFVGFKLWIGDGFAASLRIARQLRARCPEVRLFAGGPAVHFGPRIVAADAPELDAVIDGDGEEAILELARYAEGRRPLQGIPNRVTAQGDAAAATAVQDLSTLPLPDYGAEAYPAVARGEKIRVFCLDESRGCPMRCAFCINWCIEGSRWRVRGAAQVLAELRGLIASQRTRAFRLAGTYSPPAQLREICEGIIAERLPAQLSLFLHARGASDELLALLARAGAYGVFFGVESGSDAILERAMHKSITAERVRHVLRASLAAGLFTAGSLIFPAPFEDEASQRATEQLIEEVFVGHASSGLSITFPALLPRTRWWQERARYGFELDVDEAAYVRRLLRYNVRHLLPPTLWPELPYRLHGRRQTELARQTLALQAWARQRGVSVNLPDHDALVGAALGHAPLAFQLLLRRLFFTGAADAVHDLVRCANEALAP